MRDFKKGGGFRKSFGGRPGFGGGNRFGARPGGDRDQKEMFQAICSDCGTETMVPFRPVEGRPVFCRDCFARNAPDSARPPRGEFRKPFGRPENRSERPAFRMEPVSAPSPRIDGTQMLALTKQLELLNIKLDRLVQTIEVERAFSRAEKGSESSVSKKIAQKPAKKAASRKK